MPPSPQTRPPGRPRGRAGPRELVVGRPRPWMVVDRGGRRPAPGAQRFVPERVRQLRQQLGLTQGQFAALLGLGGRRRWTRSAVAQVEGGRRASLAFLEDVARVYHVDIRLFFE